MTIADTIFDTINDNWGNGGYAGTTPAIDTTETQTDSDVVTTDVVEVRHYSLRERGEQLNDKYVNRHYTIDVYISSKTDNATLRMLRSLIDRGYVAQVGRDLKTTKKADSLLTF